MSRETCAKAYPSPYSAWYEYECRSRQFLTSILSHILITLELLQRMNGTSRVVENLVEARALSNRSVVTFFGFSIVLVTHLRLEEVCMFY